MGWILPPQMLALTLLKLEQEYKEIWLPLNLHFIYNVGSVCVRIAVCVFAFTVAYLVVFFRASEARAVTGAPGRCSERSVSLGVFE